MLDPGTVIEKYEIIEPIAGGGMGVVYRARHRTLGKEVAFKELLSNLALSEKVQTRFQQEAYVQANLTHPNIVNVFDFITHRSLLAIVMELVAGPSLEQVLADERSQAWTLEQTMAVMKPVLDAVAYAHARGVVHRDIKPGNVLLDRSLDAQGLGTPKVSDFGLAKILSSEVAMTKTGARMGTVPYMAPEQFRGSKEIDARADVFALGMMLWRLLAGRLPVEPDDFVAATELYTGRSEIPLLTDVVPTIPKTVSEVVRAALSVDPSDRPLDASELLRRMERDRVVSASLSKAAPAAKPKTRGSSDRWRANETAADARAAHQAETERSAATLAGRTERAPFDWGRFGLYVGIPLALVALLLAVTGVFGGDGSESQVTSSVSDETTTQESGGADERGQEPVGGLPPRTPAEQVPPEGFVLIPGGTFTMGSPLGERSRGADETQHPVTITRDFYMQEHEVTQGEWRELMGTNPSDFSACGDDCPVENVSWYDAVDYANALSRDEGLAACYRVSGESVTFDGLNCEGYRLPTEAEWEYASRAGTSTAWYCGSSESCLDDIAWYGEDWDEGSTHRVGLKEPNGWGLHDMLGNVWEWCWDGFDDYPGGRATDPLGPSSGSYRVFRGGSWNLYARSARAAIRYSYYPDYRFNFLGFRLARSAP